MMLLCWIMVFLPANRSFSLDAIRRPDIKTSAMPRWCLWILILNIWIVYTYASVAKFYPDWLDGTATGLFMRAKSDVWLVGDFLQKPWVPYAVAYFGIIYDGLVIPALLWKRTRTVSYTHLTLPTIA